MNNIRRVKIFVIAATLVVLASLFNISCEKEQPTSEKSAVGYSERESTALQPQVAEVSQPKEMEPEEEGVGSDESDEDEEADEEDVADDLDEEEADEEDTGDTSDENEADSEE